MGDKKIERRTFLKTSGIAGFGIATLSSAIAVNSSNEINNMISKRVNFTRDGLDFSPEEYSMLLSEITKDGKITSDSYSNGGIVEELENKMAGILGKEAAVYMPTGTLANHIAVRKLAGNNSRVLTQSESHLYNDSGDMTQALSGLNLIPLAKGKATFSLDEIKEEIQRASNGKVTTDIGVISIESPVRRVHNQVFDYSEMKMISEFAKKNSIKMHLDGARMFNTCVHINKTPKEIASLFDTVYISLYKDFNAASGAILAGTKEFCEGLHHIRRMFGGSQPNAWPFAAVVLQFVDSFLEDYQKSLEVVDSLFENLEAFKLEKIEGGTNVMKLYVLKGNPESIRENLLKNGIVLNQPTPDFKGFYIKINPSILRVDLDELKELFVKSTL